MARRRWATQKERDVAWDRSRRMVRVAPDCRSCGKRMMQDDFTGMFYCPERGHGGYQTQDQVADMHYQRLIEEIEATP